MQGDIKRSADSTPHFFRFLFVCTGNICRSPVAEGIFRSLVAKSGLSEYVMAESVGITSSHVGEAPDPRAQQIALAHGVDLSGIRARGLKPRDFETFDKILALDQGHWRFLNERCPRHEHKSKIFLLLDFSTSYPGQDVVDPYYDRDMHGFNVAYSMIGDGCQGLLAHVRRVLKVQEDAVS